MKYIFGIIILTKKTNIFIQVDSINKITLDDDHLTSTIEPSTNNGVLISGSYPKLTLSTKIVKYLYSASSAFKIYITDISIEDGDEEDLE